MPTREMQDVCCVQKKEEEGVFVCVYLLDSYACILLWPMVWCCQISLEKEQRKIVQLVLSRERKILLEDVFSFSFKIGTGLDSSICSTHSAFILLGRCSFIFLQAKSTGLGQGTVTWMYFYHFSTHATVLFTRNA